MRQVAFATSTTKVSNLPRRHSASSLDTHMTTGIKRSSSFDTDMDDYDTKRSSEPERSSSRKPRSSRQRGTKQQRKLDISPEPPKRLFMCGAEGIILSDEVKESIQDVRVSVRQVVNVLQLKRKFGREELDAVGETLRYMHHFVCTSSPRRRESKVKFNLC